MPYTNHLAPTNEIKLLRDSYEGPKKFEPRAHNNLSKSLSARDFSYTNLFKDQLLLTSNESNQQRSKSLTARERHQASDRPDFRLSLTGSRLPIADREKKWSYFTPNFLPETSEPKQGPYNPFQPTNEPKPTSQTLPQSQKRDQPTSINEVQSNDERSRGSKTLQTFISDVVVNDTPGALNLIVYDSYKPTFTNPSDDHSKIYSNRASSQREDETKLPSQNLKNERFWTQLEKKADEISQENKRSSSSLRELQTPPKKANIQAYHNKDIHTLPISQDRLFKTPSTGETSHTLGRYKTLQQFPEKNLSSTMKLSRTNDSRILEEELFASTSERRKGSDSRRRQSDPLRYRSGRWDSARENHYQESLENLSQILMKSYNLPKDSDSQTVISTAKTFINSEIKRAISNLEKLQDAEISNTAVIYLESILQRKVWMINDPKEIDDKVAEVLNITDQLIIEFQNRTTAICESVGVELLQNTLGRKYYSEWPQQKHDSVMYYIARIFKSDILRCNPFEIISDSIESITSTKSQELLRMGLDIEKISKIQKFNLLVADYLLEKSVQLSFNQSIESSIKDSKFIYYPRLEAIIKEMTLETFQRALSPPKKQNREREPSRLSERESSKSLLQDGFSRLPQVQTLIMNQTESLIEDLLATSLSNISRNSNRFSHL